MSKYPKHPEMMKRRQERMAPMGIISTVPSLLVLESKCTLKAYYGTYFRAGLVLIWESFYLGSRSFYWHTVYKFCDFAGWTKLRPLRPDSEHKARHGRQCEYLNCSDLDCVDKGIPQWFRVISGIARANR